MLIMPAIPLPAGVASAVSFPAIPPAPAFATGMEIEGNKATNGAAPAFDWGTIQSATPPGPYTGANINSAGIVDTSFAVDLNGAGLVCNGDDTTANPVSQFPNDNSSNVPASGSNFNGWQIGPVSNLSDATDVCTGAAALEVAQVYAAGYDQTHYLLYQYVTRHPDATGSIVFFTVLQGPAAGRCDDYLLKFDFNPSGSSANVSTLAWAPTAGNCTDIYGAGSWQPTAAPPAAVAYATGTNNDPLDNGDPLAPNPVTFAETSVDLGTLGLLPADECATFAAAGVFTQSGNNGQLQDFLAYANPIVISNCNTLTVEKATQPAGIASSANFGYRVRQGDSRPVHDATLTPIGLDTDASFNSVTATIQAGQSHTWGNVIAEPDYLVEELTPLPAGWTLATIRCTYTDLLGTGSGTPNGDGTKTVTIYANGGYTGQNFDIFPPQLAAGPSCTITNETSGITIIKDADPNDATDFAFTASAGMTPAGFVLDDDADATLPNAQSYIGLAPGPYTVTEGMLGGWDLTGLTCTGQTSSTVATDEATRSVTIGLAAGEFVTCTFTNTKRGSITIVKDAVPGTDPTVFDYTAGGLTPAAFTLTDNGTPGADTQTFTDLAPGAYSVTELAETGWALGGIVCTDPTGGTTTDGATASIDLAPGDNIVCTYTNDLDTAEITLTKSWGPGPMGDAVSLSATGSSGQFADGLGASSNDGTANDTDAVLTVRGGETVTLAEAFSIGDAANYTTTLTCVDDLGAATSITLTNRQGTLPIPGDPVDMTCTFTNTRKSAQLTLQKAWVNGLAGDQTDLAIDATTDASVAGITAPLEGAVQTTVYAGETAQLSEVLAAANAAGYTANLACTVPGLTYAAGDLAGSYAVASSPVDVTCTFTNTRRSTTLVLAKSWVQGITGDTVTVTAGGGIAPDVSTSSTAGTGATTSALTVYSAETIDLSEVFAAPADPTVYTTVLSCTAGSLTWTTGALDGSVQIPKDPTGQISCTFTNARKSALVQVGKSLTDPLTPSASFDLFINGNLVVDDATDGSQSAPVAVLVGDTVTVAEDGNPAFSSTLSCDSNVTVNANTGTSGSFVVPVAAAGAPAPIICTFVNVRRSATLTVQKVWQNGAQGDQATLSADVDSAADPAPATSTASGIAGSQTDGTNVVTATVFAGESVDLAETLGGSNLGSYGSTLTCTDGDGLVAAPGGRSGTYTAPAAPADVTCTFTNARLTNTVIVQKRWVNGLAGDTATISASGTSGMQSDTSTATGAADETDTANAVTLTALTGETVTVGELLSAADRYNAVLTCSAGTLAPPSPTTSGSLTVPSAAGGTTTCTFTNTRKSATVDVTKVLFDAVGDSSFDLTINGTPGLTGTTGGVVSPTRTVLVGDAVTVAESANTGSLANFDSGLACTLGDGTPVSMTSNSGIAGTFTVPPAAASSPVHCTFTNTRNSAFLTLQKVWENGFTGDTTTLTADPTARAAIASEVSTAPEVPAASNTVTMTVYAGEDVSLQEAFGANTGSYDAALACNEPGLDHTAGLLSGTYTVPAEPDPVVCTFTNTRQTATVRLAKAWANSLAGDTVTLEVSGTPGGSANATSVAPDNTATTASITVYTGSTVSLAEAFTVGSDVNYQTALSCTGAASTPTYQADALTGTLTIVAADAGGTIVCTFTNARGTAEVVVAKSLDDPFTPQAAFDLSIDGTVVFPGAQDGDVSNPVTVNLGDTVGVAEAINASFDSELACIEEDQTPVSLTANVGTSGSFVVPATAADQRITCTFTNTRQSAELTLQKVWVDGAVGDSAELSADGVNDGGATSVAPDAPAAGNQATLTVHAGETVDLSETLPGSNVGSYDTTLACGAQQIGTTTSGSYTVPANPQPVTCTFTNTRQRSTLTLHKTWVDAAAGDSALLTLSGTQGDPLGVSIASGGIGTQDDAASTVTLTVLSGEVVTVSETIIGLGTYGTTLTCTGPATLSYAGGLSGTVTAPQLAGGQTDCVFTNAAGRGTIVIDKQVAGEDGTFTFNGDWAGAAPTFDVTTGVPTPGSGQSVFGGVLAGTYSVSEIVPAGYVLTGLTCAEQNGDNATTFTSTTGTLDVDAGETVSCTFANAQRGPLDVTKTVTSGPTLLSGATHRITYEVEVTSASHVDEPYNLSDTLQFGGGFAVVNATSSPAAAGWTGIAPNTALVTGGTIPALGTVTYTITVDADVAGATTADARDCEQVDGEGTGFLNTAQVTWDGGADDANACAAIPPEADVAVVKIADPAFVTASSDQPTPAVGWSMVVTNNGPVEAVGVTLDDAVPSVFTGVAATASTGSCSVNGQAVHCELGTMAVGASITVTISATVAAGTQAGTYTNVAVVGSASPPDPNPANNTDSADTGVAVVAVQAPPPPTIPPTVPPAPPVPTAPPAPPVPELLPATGGNTVRMQYLGALVIGVGLLAVAITRRRRDRSVQA